MSPNGLFSGHRHFVGTQKKQRESGLEQWLASNRSADFYLSVITIGEIERGISRQKLVDPPFASALTSWLEELLGHYSGRILPLTISIARRWGYLSATLGNNNADLMIAATALEHNLSVVTRNTKHFLPTQAKVINPFLPT